MYLFFDTETTGLPKRWNAPVTDLENWPRLVQLAWIMYDDRGNMLESRDVIVKPEGFTIPPEASRVHGITTLVAREKGEPLQEVMEQFARKIDEATALVGHNISFDECIVGAEFERLRMMTTLFLKPKYCTMKLSTDYCKLPGKLTIICRKFHRTIFRLQEQGRHHSQTLEFSPDNTFVEADIMPNQSCRFIDLSGKLLHHFL